MPTVELTWGRTSQFPRCGVTNMHPPASSCTLFAFRKSSSRFSVVALRLLRMSGLEKRERSFIISRKVKKNETQLFRAILLISFSPFSP
jgi:hypothetical protein